VGLEGAGNERLDLLLAGDVGGRELDPPAGLPDLAGRGRACLGVHVAGDDGGPGFGEGRSEDGAAAASGPGDQDDLAGER
jgi:hypothetical protein